MFRTLLLPVCLVASNLVLPQIASADVPIESTDDYGISKIDLGGGEIRYEWHTADGRSGHAGTLKEARKAAKAAIKAAKKAAKNKA